MPARSSRRSHGIVAAIAAALSMSACSLVGTVSGSGTIVEATPEVDAFTALAISSAFDVTLRTGDEPLVTVRVDDNLLDSVTVDVSGDTLRIGLDAAVGDATLEADVLVPRDALTRIEVDGAATLSSTDTLTSAELAIDANGAGRVFVVVEAADLDLGADGASVVNASGSADRLVVDADGASSAQLTQLEAADATVEVDGASRAEVNVSGTLTAKAAGASSVRYTGNPEAIDQQTSGASSIEAQ